MKKRASESLSKSPSKPMREPLMADLVLPSTRSGASSDWVQAKPFPRVPSEDSYVSGNPQSRAIRVQYFHHAGTREFAGRAWFGPGSEGPPGHAHGGSQAALLDEGMGAAAWHSGNSVVAAKIEINFREPLPLGTILTMWTEITRVEGRKVYARARLEGDDGVVYSDGTGLFIVIDPSSFRAGE